MDLSGKKLIKIKYSKYFIPSSFEGFMSVRRVKLQKLSIITLQCYHENISQECAKKVRSCCGLVWIVETWSKEILNTI